ncbi:hypothetical protein B0T21DRAFT_18803 [Apiosordaria backusii]|uniref:NACHT domain-containing protein n=1 Tax=Apiosordaria backusii TaxID=314023 RepID=A0AA40EZ53_9PEZI|nr:hypothetical protein B0T21DRAFT_18803 [Apiosordaria backusii]
MSLVRAGTTLCKAEVQLRDAIAQFEKDLNVDQQATLQTYRLQAHQSPPDVSDVMRITAEIDREVSKNKGFRGRCFGPRFTNILQSVQQFAALGDVIIGGSQNLIACGVWSLVRFSLLLMANFSTCVEKLSKLLMDVGRAAPRYQGMALLYPQSKSLRSSMCEYFTVVVCLCHQLVKLTKQSIFQQLRTFLSEQDMKSYQSELDLRAASINEEVNLLMNQSLEEQGSRLKAFMRSEKIRRQEKAKFKVLNYWSKYDYQTTWKELRKAGNTSLLQNSPKYEDWKAAKKASTLIFQGKLGCGKSVLLANIVADLGLCVGSSKCPVAFFFCRHNEHESLKAYTVIGSLVRQLLAPGVIDFTEIERLILQDSLPGPGVDFDIGYRILQKAYPAGLEAYIIVDGLDECDRKEKEMICNQLHTLQKKFTIRLCLSARTEPDTSSFAVRATQFANSCRLSADDNNADITNFIHDELEKAIETGELRLTDPNLIVEILDALLEGAQGMFLWVALQIAALCQEENQNDADIRRALKNLPKDLHETFSRILGKASAKAKGYQTRVLEVLTTVYRPLTTEELREALSVMPGNCAWNPEQLISDIYAVLASCGSLVVVDEESLTVRIIHQSVVKFLFGEFEDSAQSVITREGAARSVAEIVITYLSFDVFKAQLTTFVAPQIAASAAPSKIIHSMDLPQNIRDTAVRLLRSRKQPEFNMGKILVESSKPSPRQSYQTFYPYAKANWIEHSKFLSTENASMVELLLTVAKQEVVLDKDNTLLDWASTHNHNLILGAFIGENKPADLLRAIEREHDTIVIGNLLHKYNFLWNHRTFHRVLWKAVSSRNNMQIYQFMFDRIIHYGMNTAILGQLLQMAVWQKDGHMRSMLLSESLKPKIFKMISTKTIRIEYLDPEGRSILNEACARCDTAMIRFLLDTGTDINAARKTRSGDTPLLTATTLWSTDVAELLIDNKANLEATNYVGDTPLIRAARYGRKDMIRFLLDKGADPNAKNQDGYTVLMYSIRNLADRPQVLDALSDAQADLAHIEMILKSGRATIPNVAIDGRTALSYAAERGAYSIIYLLLKEGAHINIDHKDKLERTALMYAALKGRERAVELLLGACASPHLKDINGRTAMSYAAEVGALEAMQLFRLLGDDPESVDATGRTAMIWAAQGGMTKAVDYLLKDGDEPDRRDFGGRTALSHAAGGGHEATVRLLLRSGANLGLADIQGCTPMMWAAENNKVGVVDYLLHFGGEQAWKIGIMRDAQSCLMLLKGG